MTSKEKKDVCQKNDCPKKKERVKNVKKFMKQNLFISDHLLTSIKNSEIT